MNNDNELLDKLLHYPNLKFGARGTKLIIWPFFENDVFKKIVYKTFDYTIQEILKKETKIYIQNGYDNKCTNVITNLQEIYDKYKDYLEISLTNYNNVNIIGVMHSFFARGALHLLFVILLSPELTVAAN